MDGFRAVALDLAQLGLADLGMLFRTSKPNQPADESNEAGRACQDERPRPSLAQGEDRHDQWDETRNNLRLVERGIV